MSRYHVNADVEREPTYEELVDEARRIVRRETMKMATRDHLVALLERVDWYEQEMETASQERAAALDRATEAEGRLEKIANLVPLLSLETASIGRIARGEPEYEIVDAPETAQEA